MKILYDPECESLARHFLAGVKDTDEEDIQSLAGAVQLAVEDWLEEFQNPDAEPEGGEEE